MIHFRKSLLTLLLIIFTPGACLLAQPDNIIDVPPADNYRAKKTALSYLNESSTIEKFGKISDAIWSYAELGMQEFKSSALLMKTLQDEGFTIEKDVAGMPTCFIASWGSGKPVIGILGEFDALPMLSQKAGLDVNKPVPEVRHCRPSP